MIVVDANVVVAFLLDTPLASEAREIHSRDAEWMTSPLCQFEVWNALLQETKAKKLALRSATAAAETAMRLLTTRTDGCGPAIILTTAYSTGLTAYDATYVVLARSLGAPLITEDKQILRACPDVAHSMKLFLSPPEQTQSVREKPTKYKTRRTGKRGGA